jgi:membrane-bound serine protease (ClpP class)
MVALGQDRVPSDGLRQPLVVHFQLDDQPITPATVRCMQRVLRQAVESNAECLVIELNTPGGVLQSTQEFVTDILGSEVPVVVYVSPSGARAASAGVFITLASHVAVMAPGTRIGAAHPVAIGGLPFSPPSEPAEDESDQLTAMDQKIVNDTVAWAKSLAKLRDRNADWAAQAVTESSVLMAHEAVQQGVIDLEATDLHDMLQQIDGREVTLGRNGQPVRIQLRTANCVIRDATMWWGERLLVVISNPNVALLLMMFGVYGILFELYSPGWGVAGTLGVVSLVLGFYGLSILPVNYAGLALILIALAMFAAEAFVPSYGTLSIGGIVCLILGGTMLVDSPTGFLHVSLEVLVPIALATAFLTVFLVGQVVKAQRSRVQTGGESLIGQEAVAQEDFGPQHHEFEGQVRVHGETWRARSTSRVADGEHVRIAGREGLTLFVDTDGDLAKLPATTSDTPMSRPSEGGKS